MKRRKLKAGPVGANVPANSSELLAVPSETQMDNSEAKKDETQKNAGTKPPEIRNPALMAFMVELASNLDRLSEFVADPVRTAEKAGLSEEDRAVLFSGDQTKIYLAIANPPPTVAPQPTPAAQPGPAPWPSYYGAQPQPTAWAPAGSQPAGAWQWGAAPQPADPWQSSGATMVSPAWPPNWGAPAQPQNPASAWQASPAYAPYGQTSAPSVYIIVWPLPNMWPPR